MKFQIVIRYFRHFVGAVFRNVGLGDFNFGNYTLIEIKCSAYDNAKAYLTNKFEIAGKALFIFLKNFNIIICKADYSQPKQWLMEKHQLRYIRYLTGLPTGSKDNNGAENYQSAHGRRSFLLIFTCQS